MAPGRYDAVVVGSSPLLILAALEFRRAARSVVIVEASDHLGGAWKIGECPLGTRALQHECACHLLEWYSGGYRLLEELARYPFVPLTPQPVKVWSDGRVRSYTSKSGIVRDYALSLRALAALLAKLALSCLGVGRFSFEQCSRALRKAVRRIVFASRYRLPGLVSFDGVRGPEGGFAAFIAHLQGELHRCGVDVVHRRAMTIGQEGELFFVQCEDGSCLFSDEIIVGESSEIECEAGEAHRDGGYKLYHHVLISLPSSRVVTRNAYVHFVDDDIFHRMTFIEDIELAQTGRLAFFLVQLRRPYDQVGKLADELDRVFALYRVAANAEGLEVWKVLDDRHVPSSTESSWHERDCAHAELVTTVGDLARNAILMDRSSPWPRVRSGRISA